MVAAVGVPNSTSWCQSQWRLFALKNSTVVTARPAHAAPIFTYSIYANTVWGVCTTRDSKSWVAFNNGFLSFFVMLSNECRDIILSRWRVHVFAVNSASVCDVSLANDPV